MVGGEGLFNCHIHTNDVGAAIEAALDAGGRPRSIRITDLFEEMEAEHTAREATIGAPPHQERAVAVVAVAAGRGLAELYRSLNVSEIVFGGQTMNPSTAELLAAVERAPAPEVVILPNNKNIVPVAEQVDALTTKVVHVIPTHAAPQALAALLSYDPEGDGASVVAAMGAAAEDVRCGEVTRAVRASGSEAGAIEAGNWIGIVRGEGIVTVSESVVDAACRLLAHLVDGRIGLVTLLEGEGSTTEATLAIETWLAAHRPGVEVEIHQGGQPLYPYVIGAE
jgi:dihydroxyacetone kinase-like predicted kinase